ncbi:WD repeat-containing protein 82 [Trichuris trichiura]|uniref:WD repeat-containing protein 82 n=1 Tax=Trichuris trichiura TaxID=36087 RepID=A0A077ZMJ0_TRITR|nr:WD repeat-containing protein 82 [Trichuris trichiura]
MYLTSDVIKNMEVAIRFKENKHLVTSIDVHSSGSHVVVGSEDDRSITLFNCNRGEIHSTLYSKKYGVGLVRFLSPYEVLHTATMTDMNFTFLLFETVISLDDRAQVAIDREAKMFAAASNDSEIRLYDIRNYRRGPFALYDTKQEFMERSQWTGVDFSPDRNYLMVTTDCGYIILLDTSTGKLRRLLTGFVHKEGVNTGACFSPDSNFSGSEDGKVCVWDLDRLLKFESILDFEPFVLNGRHRHPCRCLVFNPTYMLFVSSCKVTVILR